MGGGDNLTVRGGCRWMMKRDNNINADLGANYMGEQRGQNTDGVGSNQRYGNICTVAARAGSNCTAAAAQRQDQTEPVMTVQISCTNNNGAGQG